MITKPTGSGKGWHKESLRHSRARKGLIINKNPKKITHNVIRELEQALDISAERIEFVQRYYDYYSKENDIKLTDALDLIRDVRTTI